MIPNLTFIVAAFVITIMAKLLSDKETNNTVAFLAIITIALTLYLACSTLMEAIKLANSFGTRG